MKTIIQISDCHFNTKNKVSKENLEHILMFIGNLKFDYLFITGDICESPSIEQYQIFSEILSKYITSSHIYAIAGNHDDLEMMRSAFIGTSINIDDYLSIGDFDFLFIDSSKKPNSSMPLGAGRVSNRDIKRIEMSKKETAIVIHHPIFPIDSDWLNKIGIENQNDVAEAVLNNNKIQHVMCGHGHSFVKLKRGHVMQTMSPSTSYGFYHDSKTFSKNNVTGAVLIEVDNHISSKEINIPSF